MKFIGITGGVGSGKSAILDYIKQHYICTIYLADDVAKDLQKPGKACYKPLIEQLGEDILEKDRTISKNRMAEKIFADPELLKKVNAIIHPRVREFLLSKVEEARKQGEIELFFVEAALLIECGYGQLVDEMWYIYTKEEVRRRRLAKSRGYSDEKINAVISAQLSEEEFRAGSDFVIDNSGDLYETFRQIDHKLEAYTWRQ